MRRTGFAGMWLAAVLAATSVAAAPDARADGQFTLTSSDIAPGGKIAETAVFNGFGCKGGNISPALAWSGAPAGTKSFALLVHDPDAPTGSGWWHWVVYNIPAGTNSLPAGAGDPNKSLMPAGAVQGRTDFGTPATAARAPRLVSRTTITSGCMR